MNNCCEKIKKCICSILIGSVLIFFIGLFFKMSTLCEYCHENIGIVLVLIVLIAFIFLFCCKKNWMNLMDILKPVENWIEEKKICIFWVLIILGLILWGFCPDEYFAIVSIVSIVIFLLDRKLFLLFFIGILTFISLLLLVLGVSLELKDSGTNFLFIPDTVFTKLCNIYYSKKVYTLRNVGLAFGGLMTLFLYQLRNQIAEKQTQTQHETFNQDKQFSNYLEATKLLTGKKSNTEAKIAAMFSLADVAKDHPENIGRVIQVINQEIRLSIKDIGKQTIKEWRNGNKKKKISSTALYIIRKIILDLESSNTNVDISNTIIFDVDTDFDKKKISTLFKVVGKKRPVEYLAFYHCKLKKINIIKEAKYHFCKFIHCNLEEADFNGANLWGTSFIECDLKGVKFKDAQCHGKKAKCEGVEFKDCKNLTLKQLDQMEFDNLEDAKKYKLKNIKNTKFCRKKLYPKTELKYLIVIDEKTIDVINKTVEDENKELKIENFITRDEYDKWKNSSKIDDSDKS